MPAEVTLTAAFMLGLLGSTHCVGMCGGIVSALTFGVPSDSSRRGPSFAYLLAYNVGRILSYAVAGALVGLLGAMLIETVPDAKGVPVTRYLSAGFLIALGLYIAGIWRGLSAIERLGGKVWRYIEPVGRTLLPVRHPGGALLLGILWGWLPCGLVYSTLAWSMTAGSATGGALAMAAFGLGTLPTLLTLGAAARLLRGAAQSVWARRAAGVLMIGFGIYVLMAMGGHVHGGH